MRKLCTTPLSGTRGPVLRPERSGRSLPVRPERSEAKSKDALFVLATILMIAALAGCGGNKKTTTAAPLMQTPIAGLPDGNTLMEGTITAGETRTVLDADGTRTEITCPADGPDCVISLTEDGTPQYTGGMPTIATYTALTGLPDDHTLMAGTIPAGETRTVHQTFDTRTEVTCPADGEPCVVTLGADGAESTGGAPTVTTYTTLYLPNPPAEGTTIPAGESYSFQNPDGTRTELTCPFDGEPCVVSVTEDGIVQSTGGTPTFAVYTTVTGLPDGHTLTANTIIPAGESVEIRYSRGRRYNFVCPADGENCFVATVAEDGTAQSTGDTPYIATPTNLMVWQANNGPDGTSDGAHARGLEGRIVRGSSLSTLDPLYGSGGAQRPQRRTSVVLNTRANAGVAAHTVTPTASWATANAAPTLGLTITGTGSNTFAVDGNSVVPSIGTGWNGVALSKTATISSTARTLRAVLYSDITQQPDGGSADTFYMTLGAWLMTPDSSTAASTQYDMGVFASASSNLISSVVGSSGLQGITGTATYTGPATGLYSAATYTGTGSTRALQSARAGYFTATATINVNFGTSSNFSGASGTVTNFMENGESLGNWTVTMPGTSASTVTFGGLIRGSAGGSADGRNLGTGNWGYQFHRTASTGQPDLTVGIFNVSTASLANDALHVSGAFGATRQ